MLTRIKVPSAGTVIAMVALFVALGSGAYATHTHKMGTQDLKNRAVTATKVANNAVTPRAIRNNAVTPRKIANNAVRTRHIFEGAITTPLIADEAVTATKLAPGVAISGPDGAPGPAGPPGPPGPIEGTAAGGDLAGTYPAPQVRDGAITTSKLDNSAVNTAKLANGAVTRAKLGVGSAEAGGSSFQAGAGGAIGSSVTDRGNVITRCTASGTDRGISIDFQNNTATLRTVFVYHLSAGEAPQLDFAQVPAGTRVDDIAELTITGQGDHLRWIQVQANASTQNALWTITVRTKADGGTQCVGASLPLANVG